MHCVLRARCGDIYKAFNSGYGKKVLQFAFNFVCVSAIARVRVWVRVWVRVRVNGFNLQRKSC